MKPYNLMIYRMINLNLISLKLPSSKGKRKWVWKEELKYNPTKLQMDSGILKIGFYSIAVKMVNKSASRSKRSKSREGKMNY